MLIKYMLCDKLKFLTLGAYQHSPNTKLHHAHKISPFLVSLTFMLAHLYGQECHWKLSSSQWHFHQMWVGLLESSKKNIVIFMKWLIPNCSTNRAKFVMVPNMWSSPPLPMAPQYYLWSSSGKASSLQTPHRSQANYFPQVN